MFGRKREYQRLPGGRMTSTLWGRFSLWRAPDHLLLVMNYACVEQYRRLFLSDIAAVTVRRTPAFEITNLVLLLSLAALTFPFLYYSELALRIFLGIMLGTVLLFLLINLVLGPTCRLWIVTSLGEVAIPSVRRLWTARRLLRALRPLVEAAQAPLTDAERGVPSSLAPAAGAGAPAVPPALASAGAPPDPALTWRLCAWSFGTLVLSGMLELVTFFANNMIIGIVQTITFSTVTVLTIVCVVRQGASASAAPCCARCGRLWRCSSSGPCSATCR